MPRCLPGRAASVCALFAAAALVTGGTAYAAWRTTGSGSGSGSAANGLSAFHTTATVAQGAKLYPGGSAPLTLNIDNTGNSYTLTVTSILLDTSRAVGISGGSGCTAPALAVSTPSGWGGVTVAPGASSGSITVVNAVTMGAAADNGCQGAVFTIPVTLTGHS